MLVALAGAFTSNQTGLLFIKCTICTRNQVRCGILCLRNHKVMLQSAMLNCAECHLLLRLDWTLLLYNNSNTKNTWCFEMHQLSFDYMYARGPLKGSFSPLTPSSKCILFNPPLHIFFPSLSLSVSFVISLFWLAVNRSTLELSPVRRQPINSLLVLVTVQLSQSALSHWHSPAQILIGWKTEQTLVWEVVSMLSLI